MIKKLLKKRKPLIGNNYGAMAFFLAFVFISVILLFLFAVAIPFLINFNVEFYAAGEDILDSTSNVIDTIQDASVRAMLEDTVQAAQDSTTENVDMLGFFFQYGWIFIIVVVAMVVFMQARKTIETQNIR